MPDIEAMSPEHHFAARNNRGLVLLSRCVWAAALLIAIKTSFSVLRVIVVRMGYPFELEWMEGGTLMHVQRVLEGKPVYAEPSPEFMPFLYMPGFYYLGAVFAKVFGLSLFSLRLESTLATVGVVTLIVLIVRSEGARFLVASIAGLLFLCTFKLSGGWFDLARVDSVALALALGAVAVARRAAQPFGFAACGVVAALAFFTKQNMLMVLPVCAGWCGCRGGTRAVTALVAGFLGTVLPLGLCFELKSHGWFWYYVVELPSTHGMKGREWAIAGFWRDDIARALPLAATCAALFLFGLPLALHRTSRILNGALGLALLAGAYASLLHMGSSSNDLMPAHAALAILFGLTLHGLMTGGRPESRHGASIACGVVALFQFALLLDDFSEYVPTRADAAAGRRIVEQIRRLPGDVLIVNHPYLGLLAGKKTFAHQMAMIDVYEADRDPRGVRALLDEKWAALFDTGRFSTVILDNDWYVYFGKLREHYVETSRLPVRDRELLPKTGTMLRPELAFSRAGQ